MAASSGSLSVVGKAAAVTEPFDGTFGAFCAVVRPSSLVDPQFLRWFMASDQYRQRVSSLAAGSNINNLKREHLLDLELPFPPLEEQRRIVERLNEVLAEVEEGDRRLADACALNDVLLARLVERELQLHAQALPEGWALKTLAEVADLSSGGTPARSHSDYFGDGHLWVKIGDLTEGAVDQTEESITDAGLANSSTEVLRPGTVLLAMYGASIGRTGVLDCEATTNQAICAMRPKAAEITSGYLLLLLQACKQTFVGAGYGGAQPNISQRYLKEFRVPVPPLTEQVAIIERVGALRQPLNTADESIAAGRAAAARLRQSAMAKALSGGL